MKLTLEEIQAAPWKYTTVQYLAVMDVHDPYVSAVSEYQITRMSRSGKLAHLKKTGETWEAARRCKEDWRQRVWASFEAGDFTLDHPDLSTEAKSVVFHERVERFKALQAVGFKLAAKNNVITGPIAKGQRVFDVGSNFYGEAVKVNRSTIGFKPEVPPGHWAADRTLKVQIGQLRYLSRPDLEAQVVTPPKIYIFCRGTFELGGSDNYLMIAVAEDGTVLAEHICSAPSYAQYDLNTPPRQETYALHYRFGYELVFLPQGDQPPAEVHDRHLIYREEVA